MAHQSNPESARPIRPDGYGKTQKVEEKKTNKQMDNYGGNPSGKRERKRRREKWEGKKRNKRIWAKEKRKRDRKGNTDSSERREK